MESFYIEVEWLKFPISLPHFAEHLKYHIPEYDGIVADERMRIYLKKEELEKLDIIIIENYLKGLTEKEEAFKIDYPNRLTRAYNKCKETMLEKSFDDLDLYKRKILLNMKLNEKEESQLMSDFGE